MHDFHVHVFHCVAVVACLLLTDSMHHRSGCYYLWFNSLLLMYIDYSWHNMCCIDGVVSASEINTLNQYEYINSIKSTS